MVVLIAGAFGVGKTTLAHILRKRLPGSHLYNPENTGSVLRATVGRVIKRDDYQDLPFWCPLVVGIAHVQYRVRRGDLIIPMTLWKREYFDAITRGLRKVSRDVVCLRLTASEEELRQRLIGRPEAEGGHAWGLSHLQSGIAAFNDPHFGQEIATDGKSPKELAMQIVTIFPTYREIQSTYTCYVPIVALLSESNRWYCQIRSSATASMA